MAAAGESGVVPGMGCRPGRGGAVVRRERRSITNEYSSRKEEVLAGLIRTLEHAFFLSNLRCQPSPNRISNLLVLASMIGRIGSESRALWTFIVQLLACSGVDLR